jgi:hypothetical protein
MSSLKLFKPGGMELIKRLAISSMDLGSNMGLPLDFRVADEHISAYLRMCQTSPFSKGDLREILFNKSPPSPSFSKRGAFLF